MCCINGVFVTKKKAHTSGYGFNHSTTVFLKTWPKNWLKINSNFLGQNGVKSPSLFSDLNLLLLFWPTKISWEKLMKKLRGKIRRTCLDLIVCECCGCLIAFFNYGFKVRFKSWELLGNALSSGAKFKDFLHGLNMTLSPIFTRRNSKLWNLFCHLRQWSSFCQVRVRVHWIH